MDQQPLPLKPKPSVFAWLVIPMLLVLAACVMPWDLAIAKGLARFQKWGELGKLVDLSEAMAHGVPVAMILILIAVVDPDGRFRAARLAAGAYGAGLLANVGKSLLLARRRPGAALEAGVETVWDTFGNWIPLFRLARDDWRSPWQSFPSGHSATAWGLAVVLAYFYPRGKYLFGFLACLACFQRMKSQSHFLSDVLAGAAVGCLVGMLVTRWRPLDSFFTRVELRGSKD